MQLRLRVRPAVMCASLFCRSSPCCRALYFRHASGVWYSAYGMCCVVLCCANLKGHGLQEELGLLDRARFGSTTGTSPCVQLLATSEDEGGCGRPFIGDYDDSGEEKTESTEFDANFGFQSDPETKKIWMQYAPPSPPPACILLLAFRPPRVELNKEIRKMHFFVEGAWVSECGSGRFWVPSLSFLQGLLLYFTCSIVTKSMVSDMKGQRSHKQLGMLLAIQEPKQPADAC